MEKYRLLRQSIQRQTWSAGLDWLVPEGASRAQLLYAHSPDYVDRLESGDLTEREVRRLGLPWSPGLLERSRRSVGGTIAAGRAALVDGIAVSLAGGTHHAGRDHGEGFCVFNDTIIAARTLRQESLIEKTAIIDCDVHQGNGTAALAAGDESIFTFSIHGQKNFPYRKFPGDLDIGLPDGTRDGEYLEYFQEGVERSLGFFNPDLVLYLAGADPYEGDRLGRLGLTQAGLAARDQLLLDLCSRAAVPVAIVLSGGYGRDIRDTVNIHRQTVELAYSRFRARARLDGAAT